jgi:hypothetical protein
MTIRPTEHVAAAILALAVFGRAQLVLGGNATGPPVTTRAPATQYDLSVNLKLTDEFIRWFELQYVKGMRYVAGSATDVDDLIKEMGEAKTVERYADLRRVNLTYALKHPNDRTIPDADLDRIGQLQYDHFVRDARTSAKWLDYSKARLKSGVIESYRQAARTWIPLYQKLLSAPPPPAGADMKEFVRASVTRDEYLRAMNQIAQATNTLHAALKEGVSWYVPWSPWVKGMIDKSRMQDNRVSRATVDAIYGK